MSDFRSPEVIFEELFVDLHESGIWEDGKAIADLIPLSDPALILEEYRSTKEGHDFNLNQFVKSHFSFTSPPEIKIQDKGSVKDHILGLWENLERAPDNEIPGSSLIPLSYPYVVPGGRFNEIYYWDSYFTMLGLKESDKVDRIESMILNFSSMIKQFGFIPNGNRTYFLSRSQPPFFALMVDLLSACKDNQVLKDFGETIEQEYYFWMRGIEFLENEGDAFERVVMLEDGSVMNRYFDNNPQPRAEMYKDDVDLAKSVKRDSEDLYLNIKAACESGWDFSSRWWDEGENLGQIKTSQIVPVDLNCLLFFYEKILARIFKQDSGKSDWFRKRAKKRARKIRSFYNKEKNWYCDIDLPSGKVRDRMTLAGMYPLFFKLASGNQAAKMVEIIKNDFLAPGGLRTTLNESGQQWDAPNGWAPLQWISYIGLNNYGYHELAEEVKSRWLKLNEKVFKDTGKMMEKYNVEDLGLISGGGEYPVQDGFGWTNGVYLAMVNRMVNGKW